MDKKEFWKKWIKSDDIAKVEIINDLVKFLAEGIKGVDSYALKRDEKPNYTVVAQLLHDYFNDLYYLSKSDD